MWVSFAFQQHLTWVGMQGYGFVFEVEGLSYQLRVAWGAIIFLLVKHWRCTEFQARMAFSFANLIYFSLTIFATLLFGSISALALPI